MPPGNIHSLTHFVKQVGGVIYNSPLLRDLTTEQQANNDADCYASMVQTLLCVHSVSAFAICSFPDGSKADGAA